MNPGENPARDWRASGSTRMIPMMDRSGVSGRTDARHGAPFDARGRNGFSTGANPRLLWKFPALMPSAGMPATISAPALLLLPEI